MTARRVAEIGLAVGVALGLFWRGSPVQAPAPAMVVIDQPTPPNPSVNAQAWQQRAHVQLVDQSRVRLYDPRGYYSDMILERVDFRLARLREANMSRAWVIGCDFRGADLREVDMGSATIQGCDFRGANMEHADLTDATFDAGTRSPRP